MKMSVTVVNGQLARIPGKAVDLGVEIRPGGCNDKNALKKSLKSVDVLLPGIREGKAHNPSHFNQAAGRDHQS